MTIFKVDQDSVLRKQRKIRRILTIQITLFVVLLLVFIGYTLNIHRAELSLISALVLVGVLICIYFINKHIAREQESHLTSEIELGDDYIVSRTEQKPDIRIHQEEVTSLLSSDKGLVLQTSNIFQSISIPEYLIGFEEVKSKLSAWTLVQATPKSYYLKYIIPVLLPSLGIIISTVLVLITRTIWPLILVILFYLGRSFFFTWFDWRRSDLSPREKRNKMIYNGINIVIVIFLLAYLLVKIAGKI
ncbi:MAG: hypothetical protein E3J88_05180 [Anaerolineales bacterium]|nr:MAG: hypothetical protein E3J88_05180 [Anaerolineales bacterium]